MQSPDDRAFIYEIEQAISQIEKYIIGLEKGDFAQDKMLQDAVIYQLMIIGEASSKISKDYLIKHSEIPWKEIIGMRHKLAHDYSSINLDEVWKAAKEDLPPLKNQIQNLLT